MARFRVRVKPTVQATMVHGITKWAGSVLLETDSPGQALSMIGQADGLEITDGTDTVVDPARLRAEVASHALAAETSRVQHMEVLKKQAAADSPPPPAPGQPAAPTHLRLMDGDAFPPPTCTMKALVGFALKYNIQDAELGASGRVSKADRYAYLKGRFGL